MSKFDLEAKTWDKGRRVEVANGFANCVKQHIALKKTDRLLDYGCGTGLVAYQFAEQVAQLVGMDSSAKMLEQFLEKAGDYNVKTLQHDIMHETLPTAAFDIIISSMAMHHIQDTNRFFQQAQQALTANGYLAIADLDQEDGTFHDKGNAGVWHFGFARQSILNFFANNGFQLLHFEYFFKITKNDKTYQIFAAIGQKIA